MTHAHAPGHARASGAIHDALVRSAVRLARLTFAGAAASIFVYDEQTNHLVLEASSGIGEDRVVGASVPAQRGIAGWVLQSDETVIAHDVRADSRFDREFAERTGYVPRCIVAAPLQGDGVTGVFEVLDPDLDRFAGTEAMDLLGSLARHLSLALDLLVTARRIDASTGAEPSQWNRLADTLHGTPERDGAVVSDFVLALDALLRTRIRTGAPEGEI
ncbi:GAF domain-containing protein [Micromonospora sp. Llam7]|uniref:GAF domain-containing protein n=1 Tax=Micromonospora tarapacensis TaxID=2835305 RepID=UPI001C831EAA|nr:GAF domain-containing protein [Micromonospora tarapacensis]MBX7265709.1 GAF domain-containing protein [Micromonospora tarapacensis]